MTNCNALTSSRTYFETCLKQRNSGWQMQHRTQKYTVLAMTESQKSSTIKAVIGALKNGVWPWLSLVISQAATGEHMCA
jgi:hypothetical protein